MKKKRSENLDKWLALFVVVIGTFMAILDSSIVNIAIPKMMAVFGVSLEKVKWIITAYTLALGAIIPLTGFLGEVFGTKKIYMFALSMFALGSLLCGFAWSNSSMITFRVIQALGGGMIMPVGMAIIFQTIPRKERGLALGFWGIAAMAAPAIGPTMGGYIIQHLDWRLIFNINVPIGIIGVFMAGIFLEDSETNKTFKHFDYLGFITSTIGLVSILYVLGEGSTIDWTNIKNPILLTIGILSLLFFVVNELTHENPLLELRVFKIFSFSLSRIIVSILTFALIGGTYVLPLFLQNMRGYTAMQTGMILFPSALAVGLMMPISGALFDKIGAKPVVLPGLVILTFASLWLSHLIDMDAAKNTIMLALLIRGIGLGLAMMPINTAGMNAVPQKLVGKASALANTIRQISSSLSVTIMTTIIQNRLYYNYSYMSEQITPFNQNAMGIINKLQGYLMQGGLSGAEAKSGTVMDLYGYIYKGAYVESMKNAVEISVIGGIIAIVLVLLMKDKKENENSTEIEQMH